MRFWDSSAIIPLILEEPSSESMRSLLRGDAALSVWWATAIECTSAIARRARLQPRTNPLSDLAYSSLALLSSGWREVIPSEGIRESAIRLLRVHDLRAADALQLAAALVASEQSPSNLEFVCLDDRLNDAARKEGFRIAPGLV